MLIGYARVKSGWFTSNGSTIKMPYQPQVFSEECICKDYASHRKRDDRPGLQNCIKALRGRRYAHCMDAR